MPYKESEKEKENQVLRSLIMDGESLFKRILKSNKLKNDESS